MKKIVIGSIAVALVAGLAGTALAVTKTKEVATGMSFRLVNKTGHVITSIKLKHGDKWGNDALKNGVLMDGDGTTVSTKDTSDCNMDIRVTYKGEKTAWIVPQANLCSISKVILNVKDNKLTYKTVK